MLKHSQSLCVHIDLYGLATTPLPFKLTLGQWFLELVDSMKRPLLCIIKTDR